MVKTGIYSLDENNFKIFDNMLEGVSVYEPLYDNEGRITDFIIKYVNPAAVADSGNSCEYYVGKRASELHGLENIQPHFKIAEEIIATGKNKTFKTYLSPLNKHFQVSVSTTSNGLFVMFRIDIDNEKKAEIKVQRILKELQKAYADLEVKVQERTHELQKTNESLKKEIEERNRIENALKESEEKFRLIFNKANDMISLSELKDDRMPGKYIEVNEVGCRKLGYSREEFLDMGPTDIIAPDKREEMQGNASVIAKNGCSNFEIVHITKKGKRIPVEVNGHNINYKGQKVYLTVSRDITERKQMENALKKSEEKFREIFNKANDMITLHEMKEDGLPGKFIEVNEVGCKRLGYTIEEFLDMAPVDIIALNKRVEMANNAVELWTKGYVQFEIVHITKDGKRIPVEVNTHLFRLNGKKVALGISRDISERKRTEKNLKEFLDKLSRFNEEFEHCAYKTSCEMQEYLKTILNSTKLLKERYEDKFDEDAYKFLDTIMNASVKMNQMVQELPEYPNVSKKEEMEQ